MYTIVLLYCTVQLLVEEYIKACDMPVTWGEGFSCYRSSSGNSPCLESYALKPHGSSRVQWPTERLIIKSRARCCCPVTEGRIQEQAILPITSTKRYVIRLAQRNVIIFARPFERPHVCGVLFLLPQERLSTAIVIPAGAGTRALLNPIAHPDSKCLIFCVPHNKQTATRCAMRTDE